MSTIQVLVSRPGEDHLTLQRIEPRLEPMQKLVGGFIEALSMGPVSCYLNEEGKLTGLPQNVVGHFLVSLLLAADGRSLLKDDVIVGPVVFLGPPDEEGWDTDVPEQLLDILRNRDMEIREES